MNKIITLFKRDYEGTRLVYDEVTPGTEWVIAGEGVATRKFDGTCCLVRDGKLFKRYELKAGRLPPPGFVPAQEPDEITGGIPGWVPVSDTDPNDRWHREAVREGMPPDGTYELVGPKVQGNPERYDQHELVLHGAEKLMEFSRSYDALKDQLARLDIEGIVWHHPDGRMVKLKGRDFGFKRGER